MSTQANPDPRAALAALIDGRSDDEITKGAQEGGLDTVLGQIFDGMAAAFKPAAAGNQSAVIQYDVTAPDGTHSYQLKIANGVCAAAKGATGPARITLTLALPNFLRMVAGKLNGQEAFMTGKLKLAGDMGLAMVMQSWFPT
jgi:putative sterol carrier protein